MFLYTILSNIIPIELTTPINSMIHGITMLQQPGQLAAVMQGPKWVFIKCKLTDCKTQICVQQARKPFQIQEILLSTCRVLRTACFAYAVFLYCIYYIRNKIPTESNVSICWVFSTHYIENVTISFFYTTKQLSYIMYTPIVYLHIHHAKQSPPLHAECQLSDYCALESSL